MPFFTEAARTYLYSVSGVSHLKTCGKYDAKIARQRRKNRLVRVCYVLLQGRRKMFCSTGADIGQ